MKGPSTIYVNQSIQTSATQKVAEQFPIWKLLAFSLIGFITIMTETMPVGLLLQISHDLQISKLWAGQLVSFYALGSVCAAIPIIALTKHLDRRSLLLFTLGCLCVFNGLAAISTHYMFTLFVRFCAGMAAGVIWGLFVSYVRYLVAPHLQGRALAIAGIGQPLALCFGVPLGTFLGTLLDWRSVFWIMSILALILVIWVRLLIPCFIVNVTQQKVAFGQTLKMKGVGRILLILFVWVLAHNILYTYISLYLIEVSLGEHIDTMLLIFGLAAIVGIFITGRFIDQYLRYLTLVTLVIFAFSSLCFGIFMHSIWMICAALIAWGISFGGAPILLQTALADIAKEQTDAAQSILVTIFNIAVAGGGIAGGLLFDQWGIQSFAWSALILSFFALILVYRAKDHGFGVGHRVLID
ncbi:MFS transporter [Acinetobacter sp. Tr-809]|uniref:MFS transporter n=1 Tax=Acinetobacter sp. Tr-809 TaxID=2608324 RepID=UPI00148F7736|nr:MFS transporter [Acinetobacter sp. Tr-809]NIE96802.1 MFS transporter [Acinetobacter sp. Tr-809]